MKYKHMEGDDWESKGKDGQINWRWRRERKVAVMVKGMRRKFHGQKCLGNTNLIINYDHTTASASTFFSTHCSNVFLCDI
jgi:hypothetical protein